MPQAIVQDTSKRYQTVAQEKADGATYTPERLALFVADKIVEHAALSNRASLSLLDPAIGDGELILALLQRLSGKVRARIKVRGFDTNAEALATAASRIQAAYPQVILELSQENFLDYVLETQNDPHTPSLFAPQDGEKFDLIIANPPYVRTQIMGAERAQRLASSFGLSGRVDLYQAFLLAMSQVLTSEGVAGIIVSNRFMTTRGGGVLRSELRRRFDIRQVWDLGDTKLFSAAVLPAVIVAKGAQSASGNVIAFSTIYEVNDEPETHATDPMTALGFEGVVQISDGRRFRVRHGTLDSSGGNDDIWRITTQNGDAWLATVERHAWNRFGDIGKIRVGVKTCADKIFIRHDWDAEFGNEKPELLRPLSTHHGAGRFRALPPKKNRAILYPHEVVEGQRRTINLDDYPKSKSYLEIHRAALESRSYVIEAGRKWYELWVPQDPQAWAAHKLVFRDISERPTFWVDLEGSIVNGDCYWLITDRHDNDELLWLAAAVANSTFIEAFYDHRFNNKLYAGRRRFITQYVEQFPLPDPALPLSQDIIANAKAIYAANHSDAVAGLEERLDAMVWKSFGLGVEEIGR
ncbi:MAG: N-6 DNA methylase [Steroidobacteraceae bacterium]